MNKSSHAKFHVPMQGEYQDAYDVLDSISSKSTPHFYRAAVCGYLRYAQVSEVRY